MYGTWNRCGGTIKTPGTSKKETSLKRRRHTTVYGRTLFLNKVLFLDKAA
jgi:hypothetical protein